mgnify:CR=1 FL=1
MSSVSAHERGGQHAHAHAGTGHRDAREGDKTRAPHDAQPRGGGEPHNGNALPKGLLVDLSKIDLSQRLMNRSELERMMPHRGNMLLLDHLIWHSPDWKQGVALKHVRNDEFWVPGHFPGRPLLPGVLQVEAGAQLAVLMYNGRFPEPLTPAFTRIESCSFRSMVQPGDELYLLCQELKWSRRGFTCDIQGLCNQKVTFEAQVQGLVI